MAARLEGTAALIVGPYSGRSAGMIDTLFPQDVHTYCTDEEPDPGLLDPEEANCIRNAVPGRQIEFAQGRLCARRALAHLGIRDFPLLMGKDRAPIWPENIVGSLSHCAGYCAVALGSKRHIAGLGLDVEVVGPLEEKLLPLICGASELAWLAKWPDAERGVLAKLVFSAKESVFKCVYPLTRVFLDFHDCDIRLHESSGTFTARIVNHLLPQPWNGRRLRGRFARNRERLFTGVVQPAEPAQLP